MLIREFEERKDVVAEKLAALSEFLAGRAQDTNSKMQISKQAFINAAKNLGINVSEESLAQMVSQKPLNDVLAPIEPNSDVIKFKGNTEVQTKMPVDQAEKIVSKNAKAAMRRGIK